MQPIRMQGMLEIKLKQGGNKGVEHWDQVLAVLQGETLSLFKDAAAAAQTTSRWPPINMVGAVCRENTFYRRKENTFKIIPQDGSQYMFATSTRELMLTWVKKLQKIPGSSSSSDSDDSGRASSVNLSLEKLADTPDDSSSRKPLDGRPESLERQLSADPPPKPPHTYYDKHSYPEGGEGRTPGVSTGAADHHSEPPLAPPPPPPSPTPSPQLTDDAASRDKPRKSVFRKFFTKK